MDSQGREIYIGRGYFNNVLNPGRLFIEDVVNKTAGLYIEHSSLEQKVPPYVEYYARSPKCFYKWVTSWNGLVVVNAIQFNKTKPFYVARVFAQGSLHVGKVLVGSRMFYGFNGIGYSTTRYEVLVCDSENENQNKFKSIQNCLDHSSSSYNT